MPTRTVLCTRRFAVFIASQNAIVTCGSSSSLMAYSYWSKRVDQFMSLQQDVKPSRCQCWRAERLWKHFSAKFLEDVLLVFSILSLQLPGLCGRGVRKWLSVFPIPPIPAWSFPFPFPKFMHWGTHSHSNTIPENSFPFPPIPIPTKSQIKTFQTKPHNVCNVFRAQFTDYESHV